MMFHRIAGTGLPNVFLVNGYMVEGGDEGQAITYMDMDGLYEAIATAISNRRAPLTGAEFKFMRRRAGMSQEQVGAMVDKTNQAVAKWEKGQAAVPVAEGNMMRLAWLSMRARRDIARAVDRMLLNSDGDPGDYVFKHDGTHWKEEAADPLLTTATTEAAAAILQAQLTSSLASGLTISANDGIFQRSEGMT
jgi:putative transcriptional regulator